MANNQLIDDDFPPAIPTPATKVGRPATTGDTVTVACKMPHGIHLRCFIMVEADEPRQDGSWKKISRAIPNEEMSFVVRGTWGGSAGQAYAKDNPAVAELLPGGYALTYGVPRDIWELWLKQNKTSQLVKNKIIFAHESTPSVTTSAQELRSVKSGLEPLDAAKPGERMPGGVDRRLRLDVLTQDEGTAQR